MIIPQPIADGGIVVITLYALTMTVKFAGDVVKKLKTNGNGKAAPLSNEEMKIMYQNSIHSRGVIDLLAAGMIKNCEEAVKQTTLLEIIAYKGDK